VRSDALFGFLDDHSFRFHFIGIISVFGKESANAAAIIQIGRSLLRFAFRSRFTSGMRLFKIRGNCNRSEPSGCASAAGAYCSCV
jgi:hypothetical protein